jgi:hypothetical protein
MSKKKSRRQINEEPDYLMMEALEEIGMGRDRYFIEEQDEDTRDRREARITENLSWSFE